MTNEEEQKLISRVLEDRYAPCLVEGCDGVLLWGVWFKKCSSCDIEWHPSLVGSLFKDRIVERAPRKDQ